MPCTAALIDASPVLSTTYGPGALPGVIPKFNARRKPQVLLEVAKETN